MAILTSVGAGSDAGYNFRSDLLTSAAGSTTNVELVITVGVYLHKIEPTSFEIPFIHKALNIPYHPDADTDTTGTYFKIRRWNPPWNPHEWDYWKSRYKHGGERFWSGKFWLIPPAGFAGLDFAVGPKKHRPNVYCRLVIDTGVDEAHADKKIDVVRLDVPAGAYGSDFRSNAVLYSHLDLYNQAYPLVKDEKGRYHTYYQDAYVHKPGHALGMLHSTTLFLPLSLAELTSLFATLSSGDPVNSDGAYGKGWRPEAAGNVMGYGHALAKSNARPWAHRIAKHTGTDEAGWTVSMTHVYPKPV
jgi:hypothetical protein